MHFSAKRGIAIACRLSVCLSVRLSVTLVNCDHIGYDTIRYDTIEEINVDSKAEYTA